MDVQVGDKIPEWLMESVSPARMRTMAAILRDPNPVHWDRKAVAALGMGLGERTINQGPLGLSYMVNMLHDWAGPGSIRRIYMTFPMVVLDEDRIVAMGEVTGVREENGEKLADCDIWLQRGDDQPLVGKATVVLPG
ncbi:MAG: MaoC family dehydratase [Alphaproteobacteria bacterium]